MSAWSVGGGADGSQLHCGDSYPNRTTTQLIFGPFDLSDASEASLAFWSWSQTQYESDTIFWGASTNGVLFYGQRDSGADTTWTERELNFGWINEWGDYESYLGEPEVWFMFSFRTDDWNQREGWYIDDVRVVKKVGQAQEGAMAPKAEQGDWTTEVRMK